METTNDLQLIIQEQAKRIAELEQLVSIDPLTGLYNRRYFLEDAMCRQMDKLRRSGSFSILYIDLNDFKAVNDVHGHIVGDAVLKTVSVRIKAAVREYDTCARMGGDEFAVLLEGASSTEACKIAFRVAEEVAAPLLFNNHEIHPTCSVGWAEASCNHTKTVDQLIEEADRRMYSQKRSNRVRVA